MKITSCRNCKSKYFSKLFTLGKMCFTGKFPKNLTTNIPKVVISLIMCKSCKLVQLDRNFNPKYLYDTNYGYRTGINATMTQHVKGVVKESIKIVKLKKKDSVLDIASNDGTLLKKYKNRKAIKFGIDPTIKKFRNLYPKNYLKFSGFFDKNIYNKIANYKKSKIINFSFFNKKLSCLCIK